MPNTAPPARYDLPWKAAIAHAFHDFMRFFFPASCSKINWSMRPRFRDKELAAIGFGDASNVWNKVWNKAAMKGLLRYWDGKSNGASGRCRKLRDASSPKPIWNNCVHGAPP